MSATFAMITSRMRLSLFAHVHEAHHEQHGPEQHGTMTAPPFPGKTFPADEIVWGIVIRNGFDELDDPFYHRGTTQHAYLEGNDNVSICGFRPPQSGPRTRRRSRLGLPTPGEHPMCGMCARLVVAPRPRVPVAVQSSRPPVAVPVARPAVLPTGAGAPGVPRAPVPVAPAAQAATPAMSPWVRNRTAAGQPVQGRQGSDLGQRHDSGLLQRGVHAPQNAD